MKPTSKPNLKKVNSTLHLGDEKVLKGTFTSVVITEPDETTLAKLQVAEGTLPNEVVTKTQLDIKADSSAISNIDNTSDLNKPVSTAQQAALDLKADVGSIGILETYVDNGDSGTLAAANQYTDTKADKDGETITNATLTSSSVNGVNLKTNQGVSKFLNGNGDYTSGSVVYGEIGRSSAGNQSLSTTASKLDFNISYGSNYMANSIANDSFTINGAQDGEYRLSFIGSAIIEKDSKHTFYYRVNGGALVTLGCAEVPKDNYCHSLSFTRIISLSAMDYVELWATTESNKDFKMQVGTSFSLVKL